MTSLEPVEPTAQRRHRLVDVVFVHGAGGDPYKSWGQLRNDRDSMLHWLLDDPDLSAIGVWTLRHESDKTIWGAQGSIRRPELAVNLLDEITRMRRAAMTFGGPDCFNAAELYWVAHSDGGNVVKQFLLYCQLHRNGTSEQARTANHILRATSVVVFIDTPHTGSRLASVAGRVPIISRRIRELRFNDGELLELDQWYGGNARALGIKSLSFHQTVAEPFKTVNTASALTSAVASSVAIPRHHNQIAKPHRKDESPYKEIQNELRISLQRLRTPVPAEGLRVQQRQESRLVADDLCRLLMVVVPQHEPASPSGPTSRRYSLRCWLQKGAEGQPRDVVVAAGVSDGPADEAAGFALVGPAAAGSGDEAGSPLATAMAATYIDALNQAPELDERDRSVELLPILFLPAELLASDALAGFLQRLDGAVRKRRPRYRGLPALLACSSRWSVGSTRHPLQDSVHDLNQASKRLQGILDADPCAPLADLAWLAISDAPRGGIAPDQCVGGPDRPRSMQHHLPLDLLDRIASGAADATEQDAYDAKLVDGDALFLDWPAGLADAGRGHGQRIHHLLAQGVPILWHQVQQEMERKEASADQERPHPLDLILAWSGPEFLKNFHRCRARPAAESDGFAAAIRPYICQSRLFWEDHRYRPPINARTASFRIPLR
jgi:hypothetical protein